MGVRREPLAALSRFPAGAEPLAALSRFPAGAEPLAMLSRFPVCTGSWAARRARAVQNRALPWLRR
ncbi:hypothetical protein ACWT_0843 [Actinoplanes sp. SE50]|uniref:hypothetical protein n=1 Tax=unclassified Actinoplanes TaxID=2626549 RepID=UPI00023EC1E9|nr:MULTISPECIES: hypothetical protein [unclassified Actinoplanes]AEV81857.1 hypothetical protein ACPL_960 [Actinoplanes sp. SE50/110]ATO80258.1 hypothetical protein ACWT_0843 [Actinoplanes sp. SE50]SLL97663.1 hypothetical protein ACSP50_0872 [Actinoplanes sp. SE50/110]